MKRLLLTAGLIASFLISVQAEEKVTQEPAKPATPVVQKAAAPVIVPAAKTEPAIVVPVKAESAPVVTAVKIETATAKPEWDFIQFGFWFGFPSQTQNTNVYGVKIGAPFCSGKETVAGVETALFCGATDNIEGVQACVITSISKKVSGFQGSIVNICDEVNGVQFGIFNQAKTKAFQIGLINIITDGKGLKFLPIINFSL
ncbi:MAG: hypothetical protein WC071_04325 [Victivallaceae bacterium]